MCEGVVCDVVCTGRFYDFVEKRMGRWGIVLRQPIYEKDRVDPVDPGADSNSTRHMLASFPEGYRHLAYIQTQIGYKVKLDMPQLRVPRSRSSTLAASPGCGRAALTETPCATSTTKRTLPTRSSIAWRSAPCLGRSRSARRWSAICTTSSASVDIWHADDAGFYDVQKDDVRLSGRARVRTDAMGRFWVVGAVPAAYPIPNDGPVGQMLEAQGRHPFRPAHVHFMVAAPGHETLVTHLFLADSDYLDSDVVFGVKDSLIEILGIAGPGQTPLGAVVETPMPVLRRDFVLGKSAPTDHGLRLETHLGPSPGHRDATP